MPDSSAVIAIREHVLTTAHDEFTAFVERQSRFVFRVAYAVLRNAHDAEDVVQEAFLKVYRAKAWSRMDDERAFLARTAWRLAVDRLPKRSQRELDVEAASHAAGPEQEAIENDWNAAVHRLVDALPEELRQPIALSTVDDLTSREIAEVMGIPEGTVRTRLMRARQILREKLTALMEARHAR
jgi:RNA polymerase sigma-70 factor (ECF subfamily)